MLKILQNILIISAFFYTLTPATPMRLIDVKKGIADGERFGQSCEGMGDVNGDGYNDFLVSCRGLNELYFYLGGPHPFYNPPVITWHNHSPNDGLTSFSPVNVGDELDVKIEAVGEKGDGIAKKDGFVLIVPGTNKDDEVRIRVTKVLRKVGFAEVVGQASAESKEEEDEPVVEDTEEPEEGSDSEEESEEPPEDTEDFGEDLDEEKK